VDVVFVVEVDDVKTVVTTDEAVPFVPPLLTAELCSLQHRCYHQHHHNDTIKINIKLKAKFHYAIWSQTGPKLIADLLARASSLLAS